MQACIIAVLAVTFSVATAGKAVAQPRILQGEIPNWYPFSISIQTVLQPGKFDHWCTGTLIEADRILTAYHCFVNSTADRPWRAFAASNYVDSLFAEKIDFALQDVAYDTDRFDESTREADLAIIKLPTPFYLQHGLVETVSLSLDYPAANDAVFLTGWGEIDCGVYSSFLLFANGITVSQENCQRIYHANGSKANLHPHSICAIFGSGKQGAADADDGAPLLVSRGNASVQVGVFTDGYKNPSNCYDPTFPQIFTSTEGQQKFILDNAPNARFVTKTKDLYGGDFNWVCQRSSKLIMY